jgi:hypothetical protein
MKLIWNAIDKLFDLSSAYQNLNEEFGRKAP